jgi:hypothetical protein
MREVLDTTIQAQSELNKETRALDVERIDKGGITRPQRSKLRELASKEDGLRGEIEKVRALLEQEEAQVYAFVLRNTQADMAEISRRLGADFDPAETTQQYERDVLKNLTDLRKGFDHELKRRDDEKKDQQNKQQQPPPGGQQGAQKKRLVPPLAELKMLREMQIDVNTRTKDLYDALQVAPKPNAVQRKLMERLTNSQTDIRGVLDKMNTTLQQQMAPKGGNGQGGNGQGGDGGDDGGPDGGKRPDQGEKQDQGKKQDQSPDPTPKPNDSKPDGDDK